MGQVEGSEAGKTDILRLKLLSLSLTEAHGDPKVGSKHNLTKSPICNMILHSFLKS